MDAAYPFREDAYGRGQLAENLTRLLLSSDDGLVLTIEGEWGTGKTSFLHMWRAVLEKRPEFTPVYYDAFAYDFTNDPFVSLSSTLYGALRDLVERRQRDEAAQAHVQLTRCQ
jgi:predicted KAP-like P-loop ATPase